MLTAIVVPAVAVAMLWLLQFLVTCILTDFDKQLKELRDQKDAEENDVR